MTVTFKQILYRIAPPESSALSNANLADEIKKVLEHDDYLHIVKYHEYQGEYGHACMDEFYLFFQRDEAFGVMQSVMRSLGLIEDGWDFEDVAVLDGADDDNAPDIEIDDAPETEQWRTVEEPIILNAQEG